MMKIMKRQYSRVVPKRSDYELIKSELKPKPEPKIRAISYVDSFYELHPKKNLHKYSKYGDEFDILDILPSVKPKEKNENL